MVCVVVLCSGFVMYMGMKLLCEGEAENGVIAVWKIVDVVVFGLNLQAVCECGG